MDKQLSHRDQYKMLREEIMQQLHEMNRTELWGVTAAGGVYAWLIIYGRGLSPAAWFISPCVIIFCGLRQLSITMRMRSIAEYLKRIEEITFGHNSELPGWERYLAKDVRHFKFLSPAFMGFVFWPALVIATIGVSLWQAGQATDHGTCKVNVSRNQTIPVFGGKLSISVQNIKKSDTPNGLVVNATLSAPGNKNEMLSSIETNSCLSYAGYAVRLISVSPDSADFFVSDEKPCDLPTTTN